MTQSRQSQVSLTDTPYYHCISRCVRRAYLCGEDKYTEKSFEHRRQWVVERMQIILLRFLILIFVPTLLYFESKCLTIIIWCYMLLKHLTKI